MKKIIDFNSRVEFDAYIKQKTCENLGSGSEGSCFRGVDGKAYKCLEYNEKYPTIEYDIDKIITTADITNDSFAFPEILFTINGDFVGYTSTLISPNLFSDKLLVVQNTIDHINFDKLIDAYHKMKMDVVHLTSEGIKIYDLPFNILFDGEKLVGIDTCCYSYDKSISLEENIGSLDMAIKQAFTCFYQPRVKMSVLLFIKNIMIKHQKNS